MNDLLYVLKFFGSLPFWLRFLLYLLFSGIIVAIAGYWGKHAAIIAAIVCLVLGILMLVFSRLSQWVRERKAAELRGEGLDFGVPSTLVDTDLLERLSNLRREFANGIHKFQVFGKDLYEMPWYIMIGEHGAGKTEAVLHSKVDLPRDLQNQPQESIGSAHLNWWFTNYGVLLDTSGDMIFRAEDTSVTPDWTEFLELLKKHRTNCPSNGIIIAIPADSLLNDSPKEIDRKAGIVARHLDKLQDSFKVKLPVYVLVTKCDLLEGFLPFFDGFKDPKLQQQMLGWSNPAPLEAPFRPEIFEDFIHSVINRLRRIRLDSLSSPIPQGGGRRADEVDELYGLPDAMLRIVSPLRSFLEDIFVPRQWAMSPLFLRGVYFTSACPLQNEPEVETADAVVPVEPEKESQVSWYNKTSYFLRDVFLAKIFREDGLVTISGTDFQKNLRFRSLVFLLCVGFLALMIFQISTNYIALMKNITPQLPYWNRAAAGWDKKGYFSPIVVPDGILKSAYSYAGNNTIGPGPLRSKELDGGPVGNYSTFGFLEKIALLSATLPPESYFRLHPLASLVYNTTKGRYVAQRVIFEGSVVKPLLDATREKMCASATLNSSAKLGSQPASDNVQTREATALLELITLESGIIQRGEGQTNAVPGVTFIPSLLEYVCRTNSADLVVLMNWTYGVNPVGKNTWPPGWISGGNTLESNKAINAGIENLIKGGQTELDLFEKNIAMIQKLAEAAEAYSEAESKLFAIGSSTNSSPVAHEEMDAKNAIENLESSKVALEQNIHLVKASGLFGTGPQTLLAAVNRLKQGNESYFGVINGIMSTINQILPATSQTNQVSSLTSLAGSASVPGASSVSSALQTATNLASLLPAEESKKYQLFKQIQQKLSDITGKLSQRFASAMSDKQLSWYRTLDQNILQPYDNKPSYQWRWDLYKLCENPATGLEFNENMYLVGQQWYQVGQLVASLNGLYNTAAGYTGPFSNEVEVTCSTLLQRFKNKQIKLFVQNYVKQAQDALRRVARFPLVYPPGPDDQALDFNQLVAAKGLLDAISQDLQSTIFTSLSKIEQQPAIDFAMKIAPLYNVVDALVLPNGTPARLAVTLFNGQAQKQLSGPNYAPLPTPTPTPTPPPRSAMSKLFFDIGAPPPPAPPPTAEVVSTSNWNAIQLVGEGGGGVFPLDSPTDVTLGTFSVEAPFSFAVYHSLISTDGAQTVDGGGNWSALRLIAKLGGTRVGVGQDWRVALMPDQSHGVWVRFSFELPLPPTPWPTVDSIGLRSLNSQ